MAKIIVNNEKCKGCNLCVEVCEEKAIRLAAQTVNSKGFHPAEQNPGFYCNGCGNCVVMCPDAAITLEEDGGEPPVQQAKTFTLPRAVEPIPITKPEPQALERVFMRGNEAVAEAAIIAGCKLFCGYPITPQAEVAAYMSLRMPESGGTHYQSESELAAINAVLGASAAGVRAMTTSSSPGISLMMEGISYMAGCDLPGVIVNVQRAGPGLGGIQPSQSDYFQATRPGHGDFHMITLAPNSVQEIVDLTQKAFDLADKYRMQVMILTDAILGQMMEPVILRKLDKADLPEKSWAVTGHKNRRAKNIITSLFLDTEYLEKTNFDRFNRYAAVEFNESLGEEYMTEDADIILTAFGSTSRICKSAVSMARCNGIKVGLIRPITVWPFPKKLFQSALKYTKAFLCVEMNMGQMLEDVKLSVEYKRPVYFCGHAGGMTPTPEEIFHKIEEIHNEVRS